MKSLLLSLAMFGCLLPVALLAQLPAPNKAGAAMGHHHVWAEDFDLARRLWVDGLGAKPVMMGSMEVYLLPDTVVLIKEAKPKMGSEATVVNHIAFSVRDREAAEAKWKAAGGELYEQRPGPDQVFLRFPGDLKIELTEDTSLDVPIRHHHIHWYTDQVSEMKAWYVKNFGAIPGKRGKFEAADIPGANLSFSDAEKAPAGTQGSAIDHIGFEIDGLEAFCKKLEAEGVEFSLPYKVLPQYGIAIAFFTDPWGTHIELTEGLDELR